MNSDPLTVGLLYTNFHSKDFTSVRNGLFATKKGGYSSPTPQKKKMYANILLLNLLLEQMKMPSQSEEKRAEALLPDVKPSAPELMIDRVSSPDLGNVETDRDHFMRCYNCVAAPLCSHLVVFLEKNTQEIKKVLNKHFKTYFYLENTLIIYPVFEIGEITPSSAASEARWIASGCPKRTLAQRPPPASTGCHETATTEAASSSVVSERDAKCL